MSKIKEFEELDSQDYIDAYSLPDLVDSDGEIDNGDLRAAIEEAQKDAWNAAIKWAAENADSEVKFSGWGKESNLDASEAWSEIDKQSILNGLIDD